MRHHAEVMSILRTQRSDRIFRSVWVERVFIRRIPVVIDVSHGNASFLDSHLLHTFVRPETLSFTMRDPYSQSTSLHSTEEHRLRVLNSNIHKSAFQFSGLILDKARLLLFGGNFERHVVDLTHQLAAIAHTQTESVFLLNKPLELLTNDLVIEYACTPTSSAIQHILRST